MCFTSANKTKYIATEDIICYKEVERIQKETCRSYWTEFTYEFGKLYTLLNSKAVAEDYLNSPKPEEQERTNNNELYPNEFDDCIDIHTGFHSYKSHDLEDCFSNVECIIPKGSEYYQNLTEYVSNQIIIVKEI